MATPAQTVIRTYLVLTLLTTLSASFIWGINTLFLLDAGLDNTQAFTANAFFTLGEVLFEVPTGVVADTRGRRFSFLLGAATLLAATLLYLVMWQMRARTPRLGDRLDPARARVHVLLRRDRGVARGCAARDRVRGHARIGLRAGAGRVGVAMLTGSVLGGFVAQATNLGVPYLMRAGAARRDVLIALRFMHDIGFTPSRGASVDPRSGRSSVGRSTAGFATARCAG